MLFLVKRITLQPGANHTWGSPAQKEGNFTETVLTEFSVERFPVDEFSLEGIFVDHVEFTNVEEGHLYF